MESLPVDRKRPSPAPQRPWQRPQKDHRRNEAQSGPRAGKSIDSGLAERKEHESFAREQTRRNQVQEAEQMREWVSKEDEFVLKQSKKKAKIRVKEGRAKVIDWLAVTLSVIDPTHDPLEDEPNELETDIVDPTGILEALDHSQLQDLVKDIDNYMVLETNRKNRNYWNALQVICKDLQNRLLPIGPQSRSVNAVSKDVDRILGPKSLDQLETLEKQISSKLQSDDPIDVEYWEQLLRSISIYKAKAELGGVYKSIIQGRMADLGLEQTREANLAKDKLSIVLVSSETPSPSLTKDISSNIIFPQIGYSRSLDPEPQLKLGSEDKALDVIKEHDFVVHNVTERQRVIKMGYVPLRQHHSERHPFVSVSKPLEATSSNVSRFAAIPNEDFSQATTALYEREVARGVQEDEEIFAGEEEVSTTSKPQWASKYRPRKPRYFNRVQMGYEWNKYNQTHYDHDNPPPKVVQGYKFNIFYPDLIDKVKAPTYRIEREGGRKRGQSFAPAGEEDTCLIRFVSGPPYEDLAFRIVDKEWDYSAKRERGFRSSFDKGILQLHFQFKKVYYRK